MNKKIKINELKTDVVDIYYPDGQLIVSTDNVLIINDIRAQIYENDIEGCYAICKGEKVNIDGSCWPFNNYNKNILARLIIAKEIFRKKHK